MELCNLAEEYFEERMQKIYLIDLKNNEVNRFFGKHLNPKGRYCYYLTVLALLGLSRDDKRYCGMIDTMPRPGYERRMDYLHSWVEYHFLDEFFVYDPLVGCAIPQDVYYNTCKPRKVTSQRTQVETIKPYVNSRYAYRVSDTIWTFKRRDDVPDDMQEEATKYIFSALQLGRLVGRFDDTNCEVLMFGAMDPRVFEEEV